ncbi:MAG: glycosyltransferase [Anaerolineae bacterium]
MRLVLATHVYPLNPHAPTDIPGNFIPPFVYELCRRGVQVQVLAPNRPGDKTPDPDAPVRWFEWPGDGRNLGQLNPLNPLDAYRLIGLYRRGTAELQNLIDKHRADAVLACWAVPSGAFAARAKRALGVPYVVWALGSDIHTSPKNPILRPMVLDALKHASLRYANSIVLGREVERLGGLPCGFLPTARTLPDAPPIDLSHDRVNFLFAGRLEPVKGADLLIRAMAQLRAEGIAAHLYLAGNGSQERELRESVRQLGLDDAVTFLGFMTEGPLAAYLRAVDAVVIPSRSEALPVILTEAARLGTPAVASDVGDMGILARQYETAIVVEPENVAALAQGLAAMARADRAQFRKGLPALVARFDYRSAAETLLADLQRMIK